MWLAIAMTVMAATGNSVGKVLQKQAAGVTNAFEHPQNSKSLQAQDNKDPWLPRLQASGTLQILTATLCTRCSPMTYETYSEP